MPPFGSPAVTNFRCVIYTKYYLYTQYMFALPSSLGSLLYIFSLLLFLLTGEVFRFVSSSMHLSLMCFGFAKDDVVPRVLLIFGTYGAHILSPSALYFPVYLYFVPTCFLQSRPGWAQTGRHISLPLGMGGFFEICFGSLLFFLFESGLMKFRIIDFPKLMGCFRCLHLGLAVNLRPLHSIVGKCCMVVANGNNW